MRHFLLIVFLITVVNPYSEIDYESINVYIIDEPDKTIRVYEPEPDKNETEFSEAEIKRFTRKINNIINHDYSSYVFEQ